MPLSTLKSKSSRRRSIRKLNGIEDRYMALYGKTDWNANDMDLCIHCDEQYDQQMKDAFLARLQQLLLSSDPLDTKLLRERAVFDSEEIRFVEEPSITVSELTSPRVGVYFDLSKPGIIRVVWNHMQTDGVGMWRTLRKLFDPNPALVPYSDVQTPPRILPEVLAIPSLARRITWRGKLKREMDLGEDLFKSIYHWSTDEVKMLRDRMGRIPFNLLTSAMAIQAVFDTHPERRKLTVGLTVYFPFLSSRNKYAVLLCKVKRAPLHVICNQLRDQTKSQILGWGQASLQSLALKRLPDRLFMKTVAYFRRQIDILISNLPVGREPASIAGVPTLVTCHPRQMTIPYYFLMVGTGQEITVSVTTKFDRHLILNQNVVMAS